MPTATEAAAEDHKRLPGTVTPTSRLRRPNWQFAAPDVLIALALTVTGFLLRRRGLPHDGLWHDDAAPALGAVKASAGQLLTVGFDHPGFILTLRAFWPFTGGDSAKLADLSLVAGTLTAPALYVVLRRFGFTRSISTLLGAALVASETDIVYSGRVKTYAFDVLVVLGLAVLVPVLARYRWQWYAGVAWFAGAIVLGSLSAFALLATAVAGIILVLHAREDRTVRLVAVGAQLTAAVAVVTTMQRTYNPDVIATYWEKELDGFPVFSLNPFRMAAEVVRHLTRVATVFPGGSPLWAALSAVAAGVGLLWLARTGRHAVRARFLLAVVLVAFAGGVLHKIPFGPIPDPPAMGGRVTLWLVPVVAIGLAGALQLAHGLTDGRSALRISFNVIAYALAIAVVIAALARDTRPYPFPGSKSATEFIESGLGKHDAVFVVPGGRYSFALETKLGLRLRPQPERNIGFAPRATDPRLIFFDSLFKLNAVIDQIRRGATGADRVFIHAVAHANPGRWLFTLEFLRRSLGFEASQTVTFDSTRVVVWRR